MTTEFTIPHTATVPCQTQPEVFFHPDLDIDTTEDTWRTASTSDKAARVTAQADAEARAVALCTTCPLLTECRQWAATTRHRIFGVVGGLLPAERDPHDEPIYVADHERDSRGRVRSDVVHRLLRLGLPHRHIAERMHCSERTIARIAAGRPTPTEPKVITMPTPRREHKKATSALNLDALSPETQKIYEYLSSGTWMSREELLTELADITPAKVAMGFAPKNRTYPSDDDKYRVGARRFLLNRVDIAIRRGRIHKRTTDDGEVLLRLSEAVAMAWGLATAS